MNYLAPPSEALVRVTLFDMSRQVRRKASVGCEDARQDGRSEAPLGGRRQSDTDLHRLQACRRTHRRLLLTQEEGL